MKIVFAELPKHVDRTIKVTPPGESREGKLTLQYARLSMAEAEELVVAHDNACLPVDEEGNPREYYADRDSWLMDCMQQHLVGWSLENGTTGDAYEINKETLSQYLAMDVFYWATYRDFMDYITAIANGKSKSEQESELKNLLNSAKSSTAGKRGRLLA